MTVDSCGMAATAIPAREAASAMEFLIFGFIWVVAGRIVYLRQKAPYPPRLRWVKAGFDVGSEVLGAH